MCVSVCLALSGCVPEVTDVQLLCPIAAMQLTCWWLRWWAGGDLNTDYASRVEEQRWRVDRDVVEGWRAKNARYQEKNKICMHRFFLELKSWYKQLLVVLGVYPVWHMYVADIFTRVILLCYYKVCISLWFVSCIFCVCVLLLGHTHADQMAPALPSSCHTSCDYGSR